MIAICSTWRVRAVLAARANIVGPCAAGQTQFLCEQLIGLVLVVFLADGDGHAHTVAGRWEGAGCVRGVGARRIVGLVEVEDYRAVLGRRGDQKTRRRVGLL